MKTFKSDNYSGIHPKVLESITQTNIGHSIAYGDDEITQKCNKLFNTIFEKDCKVVYVFNGTGANVLAIKNCLRQYEAIICAETAHINSQETGAAEAVAGVKLCSLPTTDGKITANQIKEKYLENTIFGKHSSKCKMVSITQCTEFGTVYTVEELKAIKKVCVECEMYLHIDCCRVYNACASLDCTLAEITSKIGADIISLGGTKLGAMIAESIVIFNPKLAKEVDYMQKNTLQLYSKNRFIACQYLALFQDNLWLEISNHQNKIAKILKSKLVERGYKITQKVESNHLFVKMPMEVAEKLQASNWCYIWPEKTVSQIRLVTSFDSTVEDVDNFMRLL
jgi:threonine aldolase